MIEVKAPGKYDHRKMTTIFLAGSISMGEAVQWQSYLVKNLTMEGLLVLNPRRDDFDPLAEQTLECDYFFEQVNWELEGIENSDIVFFYFDPATQAPITLLELGLASQLGKRVIVCCPEGFYRRGNVQIVCQRYDIPMVDTLDDFIKFVNIDRTL